MANKDVRAAQKGDSDAFARLIHQYKHAMYRVARSYGLHDDDCGDVLQETVLRAFRSIGQLKDPNYFSTWLLRIVINEVKRHMASRKNVVPLDDVNLEGRADRSDMETYVEVREAIASLDDELKEIVLLYYMEDVSTKDIARLTDIPEGTVKSRLSRARAKLAAFLRPKEDRGLCHE